MQTIEQLRELFEYNDWANRRMVTAVKTARTANARKILAHLLLTEAEYYERLYGKDSSGFDFWRDLSAEDCGALARETADRYEKLLRRFEEEGLDLKARYVTSEGAAQKNTFRELLTHVLFHSAIHRGAVAAKLREADFAPPPTDYIIYLREVKYL